MPKTPEGRLKEAVTKRLTALARFDRTLVWRKRHGSPMGLSGDPDIYGLWAGIHFEIELKAPGKNPTALQQFRRDEWMRAGARCFTVHSLQELHEALERIGPVNSTV